jgi:hypothetical protein
MFVAVGVDTSLLARATQMLVEKFHTGSESRTERPPRAFSAVRRIDDLLKGHVGLQPERSEWLCGAPASRKRCSTRE